MSRALTLVVLTRLGEHLCAQGALDAIGSNDDVGVLPLARGRRRVGGRLASEQAPFGKVDVDDERVEVGGDAHAVALCSSEESAVQGGSMGDLWTMATLVSRLFKGLLLRRRTM